jgi:nucleoid DNA-binding protein
MIMPVFHKIKAQLYDNVLTENTNDFIARVMSEKSLFVADVARSAQNRGGASISAEDMEHAVNLFLKEMCYCLCDGFSINTGYFTAQTLIKGVFNSASENFNPEKHSVSFDFHQG